SRAVANSRRNSTRLANLQQQMATGLRLQLPSDGPLDMTTVLANKSQLGRLEAFLSNLAGSRSSLNNSVSALTEAGNILSKAGEIAIEGSHGGTDVESRNALATQVDALLTRLVETANTQYGGRYLFGGTASHAAPFTVTADAQGRPQTVSYVGAGERAAVPVGP